ncbi:MAG: putative response regulator receiver protein [Phycisphaerales bacterium]|nr:putative response regulator receiver protein [Phycisphaerales bacterium]
MERTRPKVLVLAGHSAANATLLDALRANSDVVEAPSIDQAIEALRHDQFDAIFSDAGDFLPLERALVSQQTQLVLNTIGEGICIVDGDARCNWMNKKMQQWPAHVHERIRRTCQEAFLLFKQQVSPPTPDAPFLLNRSKKYALNVDDAQFLEMIASPVISPAGQVVQVVAVVWDATSTRRLQQKIDAIDKAGRELVRLEADAMARMNVGERLKLLEEKIIRFTRDLMHFDHFNIRLLDRKSKQLEWVIGVGLPSEAMEIELFAETEGNGISGYVAASGRSYICPDVERDPRYVQGLHQAKSSLTVPLRLHDKVIGIFNIESGQRAAFNEDDRQFAEIFARYVAIALNILDLMIVERVSTSHKVADDVCSEVAGPLNDIASDTASLMDDYIGNDDLRKKLQQIMENVGTIRRCLKQAAEGPNHTILGAGDVKGAEDPILGNARILVADDEANLRTTIHDILRKYHVTVTTATNGAEAIAKIETEEFDLVLSDIKMPDKTGYDVFAAARKKGGTLPVILMTGFGYDPNHSIVRASQEGLQAVLFKPFKVEQLLTEVRKALSAPVTK